MTIDTLGALSAGRPDRTFAPEGAGSGAGRAPAAIKTPAGSSPTATTTVTTATMKPEATTKMAADSMDELKDAVGKLNASVHAQNLEFSIDEDSKRTIVKVIDTSTKEVVRQMPTKEALEIAKSLDKAFGLLIRQQA